jgi:hypothetical protein
VDGDKDHFFTNFIESAESVTETQGRTISVIDDSVPEPLRPCDDEAV